MRDPWTTEQIQALAPDTSSWSAARGIAASGKWESRGRADGPPASLFGLAKGSGSKPYQACVDLDAPAYRCSCPSRKFPCKHALGLLLAWSAGGVDEAVMPAWVTEWHESRADRAAKADAKRAAVASGEPPTEAQLKAAAKRAAQRDDRVGAGVAELGQWLDDQVRDGIAGLHRAGYQHFDRVAARLVDAQAPGLAREVRALAGVAASGAGWDARLLSALGGLRLLTRAYERLDALPPDLADTVRAHVGFTVATDQVMAGPRERDRWQILGSRDESEDRLTTRRTWLLGRDTGRHALILAFAAPGQVLSADLVVGTMVDADLCFFPGAAPLRAVVAHKHAPAEPVGAPAPATGVAGVLDAYATALAADPWLPAWPAALRGVLVPGSPWHLVDAAGDALPIREGGRDLWPLVAEAAGRPAVYAGEWDPDGLRVLAVHADVEVAA
jgi:hypothetical protein